MVSYGLYVAIDATPNTGKKTSKMVDLIISEVLINGVFDQSSVQAPVSQRFFP